MLCYLNIQVKFRTRCSLIIKEPLLSHFNGCSLRLETNQATCQKLIKLKIVAVHRFIPTHQFQTNSKTLKSLAPLRATKWLLDPLTPRVMSSAEVLLCVCCISVGGLHFIALCVFCLKPAWRCRTLVLCWLLLFHCGFGTVLFLQT